MRHAGFPDYATTAGCRKFEQNGGMEAPERFSRRRGTRGAVDCVSGLAGKAAGFVEGVSEGATARVTIVPSPESARDCVHWMHRGKPLLHEWERKDGRSCAGLGGDGQRRREPCNSVRRSDWRCNPCGRTRCAASSRCWGGDRDCIGDHGGDADQRGQAVCDLEDQLLRRAVVTISKMRRVS